MHHQSISSLSIVRATVLGVVAAWLAGGLTHVSPPVVAAASSTKQAMLSGEPRAALETSRLGVRRQRMFDRGSTYIRSHIIVKFETAESPLAVREAMDLVQAERIVRPT